MVQLVLSHVSGLQMLDPIRQPQVAHQRPSSSKLPGRPLTSWHIPFIVFLNSIQLCLQLLELDTAAGLGSSLAYGNRIPIYTRFRTIYKRALLQRSCRLFSSMSPSFAALAALLLTVTHPTFAQNLPSSFPHNYSGIPTTALGPEWQSCKLSLDFL